MLKSVILEENIRCQHHDYNHQENLEYVGILWCFLYILVSLLALITWHYSANTLKSASPEHVWQSKVTQRSITR